MITKMSKETLDTATVGLLGIRRRRRANARAGNQSTLVETGVHFLARCRAKAWFPLPLRLAALFQLALHVYHPVVQHLLHEDGTQVEHGRNREWRGRRTDGFG